MAVRVAVIGAGIMGSDHARIIAHDLPTADLRVICDASLERARAVATTYGATEAVSDADACIQRKDIDAIVIASPDDTHPDLTLTAIRAGKPVLCEKPLASASADCQRVMAEEVQRGQRLVQLGFMRRFDPSYVAMKAALADGVVGPALIMHNFHRNVSSPGTWFTGDMAISNSASHEFDIARFVLGSDIISISAWQPRRTDQMVAPVMMVLENTDGQLITVEINNNAAYGYDVRGELVGQTGSVSLKSAGELSANLNLASSEPYPEDWRPRFAEAYRRQNKAWIQSIEKGSPDPTAATSWDGYCAAVVGEAGVLALNQGRRVQVELTEMPPLYKSLEIMP